MVFACFRFFDFTPGRRVFFAWGVRGIFWFIGRRGRLALIPKQSFVITKKNILFVDEIFCSGNMFMCYLLLLAGSPFAIVLFTHFDQ